MYDVKEMIRNNTQQEKDKFGDLFKDFLIDLNNKIDKAIESNDFKYEGERIYLESKDYPRFFEIANKLIDTKIGKRFSYSNTVNKAEYSVSNCFISEASNCAVISLYVINHPNNITFINVCNLFKTNEYVIYIR
ncbi:hypothetical protein Alsa2_CDS0101 [Staphylococcus phage Alsa_2]|nr:hypothetical protein Alsa2_CDS0101 [Staphylococcus phage Alsa_2]